MPKCVMSKTISLVVIYAGETWREIWKKWKPQIRVKIRKNNTTVNQMWWKGDFGRRASLLWCCNFNMHIWALHPCSARQNKYEIWLFMCKHAWTVPSHKYIKTIKLKLFRNALLIFFFCLDSVAVMSHQWSLTWNIGFHHLHTTFSHIRLYQFKWYLSCL